MKQRNIEKDNRIDITNLTEEMSHFPSTLYSWLEEKSNLESRYDIAKTQYEETRAQTYIAIKSSGEKITESNVEARIETDPKVQEARNFMFRVRRDMETVKNYVESLRAKKDMLIQTASDRRKEQ